ncbi:Type 4 prepilin-like proteins leader peptide-processing enzyme [bacterium HR40]|nr:Type 4 prepilin-like proteins leader peptide-processing enzyme [bacterium HR40]
MRAESFALLLALPAGACVGSFLATVRLRARRGESWIAGRSHCDGCGVRLPWPLTLPLVGYLLSRGRCRFCRAPIDPSQPLLEGGAALLAAAPFLVFPPTAALALALLGGLLLALSLADLEAMRLPDPLVAAVALLALLLLAARHAGIAVPPLPQLDEALMGAALAAGFLVLLRCAHRQLSGREGLGWGDVKLAGASGLWLGPQALPAFFLLAGTLGLLAAIARGALRDPARPVPFGPALALALFLLLLLPGEDR